MTLSCWQDRSFEELLDADVAVVGAGFSGAAVAWWLAHSGLGVTVLERASAGAGASGAGRGRIAPPEALPPGEPRDAARAGRGWLLERLLADREHRVALRRGADGALHLDPRRLVELLLEDVMARGGVLRAHTEVVGVDPAPHGVSLRCPACTVHAEAVAVGVGVGLAMLLPGLAGTLVPRADALWARPRDDTWEVGDASPAPREATHAWRRERLCTRDGLPRVHRAAAAVYALVGVQEERWDLGFFAANRLTEMLVQGRDPEAWLWGDGVA